MKRAIVLFVGVLIAASGCSKMQSVKPAISKDVALEDQEMLLDKYVGRHAWTRIILEDLTEQEEPGEPRKKIVPMDSKVEVVDLTFSYNGAVIVKDSKNRNIIQALDIERPLSVAKIDSTMAEIFWFEDPVIRQVHYIRQWGKKTARAVRNHEVFIGMPQEAARESWGPPSAINKSEIGGKNEQQWVYKGARRSRYIYVVDGIVTKWEE